MTAVLLPMLMSDDYAPQRAGHAPLGYTDSEHLWWQSFCSCWSRAMEQFTATSHRCWPTIQSVPAVIKDIFVWIVGPRCTVNLRRLEIILLTYLYKYLIQSTYMTQCHKQRRYVSHTQQTHNTYTADTHHIHATHGSHGTWCCSASK